MLEFYKFLGSLKVAILWIIAITILLIVGIVIPQGSVEQIINSSQPEIIKAILVHIQAYDIYHSPIFLAVLASLFLSLGIATFEKIIPISKLVFSKTDISKINLSNSSLKRYEITNLENTKAKIKANGFKLISEIGENENLVYFEKNKWSRLSPLISHISLFIILFGVIVTNLTSFKNFIILTPPEEILIQKVITDSETKGKLVFSKNENWSVRANKFWKSYYKNQEMIKQYYTDISIIDNNTKNEIFRKTISVNEPLLYRNIYFYQSSWGIGYITVKIDNKDEKISLNLLDNYGYVSKKVKIGKNNYVFYVDRKNSVYVFDLHGKLIDLLEKNVKTKIENVAIELNNLIEFTGLQVKKDLGIPFVYFGFVILIIALIINFFAYKQIYLIKDDGKFYIIGKSNKNTYLFNQELKILIN